MKLFRIPLCLIALLVSASAVPPTYEDDPFRQLEELLPTANSERTASGAPGEGYWQQRADYEISVALDDKKQSLTGEATIRYYNKSPHTLPYLWVQLDQNRFDPESDAHAVREAPNLDDGATYRQIEKILAVPEFDGGFKLG